MSDDETTVTYDNHFWTFKSVVKKIAAAEQNDLKIHELKLQKKSAALLAEHHLHMVLTGKRSDVASWLGSK